MKTTLGLLALAILGFGLWVRLAPTDAARWHVAPTDWSEGVTPGAGSHRVVLRVAGPPSDVLSRLDAIALATSRTDRLAGSVEDALITYVTRSALWGFPDYTTVAARADGDGTLLSIYGRLRFGGGDLGVNRARVEAWLSQLT